MRRLVAGMAAAALLAGCGHTTRYTTTPAALRQARLVKAPALPVRRDGEPVWIATDRIASERWLPDGTTEVEARDPGRGLRIGGWIIGGTGLALVAAGLFVAITPSRSGEGRHGLDILSDSVSKTAAGLTLGAFGAPFLLGGAGLLVAGYLTDGPEVPPPAANARAVAR